MRKVKKDKKETGKKFSCNFCKLGLPHMFVVLSESNDIHVHAPFENKYLMNQFMEAIIREQNSFDNKSELVKV